MSLEKQIFSYLVLYLFLCSTVHAGVLSTCEYTIDNSQGECKCSTIEDIFSTMDSGTSLFTVSLHCNEEPFSTRENDIFMITSSKHYDLNFVNDHHDVVVKNCLQAGNMEYLVLQLNETLPNAADCGVWSFGTFVDTSTPDFAIPSPVTVNVSACLPEIDVFELQFHNDGNCSFWACHVNCTNDEKTFWTEGRTVRTSTNNINFNFTYEIKVTCFDETAGSLVDDTVGDETVNVSFVDATDTCAETPVTTPSTTSIAATETTTAPDITKSTTSDQGMIQQQDPIDFFQSPTNVALLAFFGGFILGIAVGVLLYWATKRNARKSTVGNSAH